MQVFDMSKYQRIIAVSGGRITGSFYVSGSDRDRDDGVWITSLDVNVWDEGHSWGRVYYSNDLKASVKNGEVKLSKHMVASNKLAEVEDVWDDMISVLAAVAEEYWRTAPVND